MPVKFNEGMHPIATLKQDSYGNLHLWEGEQYPSNHPTNPKVDNRVADVFFQSESDVQSVLDQLTEDEREHLEDGYAICTTSLPSDYFIAD